MHRRAEKLEHNVTDEETEALAATTGHSNYDPHGDQIPTESGQLPPKKGQALTDLAVGKLARIIYIEDEPSAIYAQLVAEGLHPGSKIQILEKN